MAPARLPTGSQSGDQNGGDGAQNRQHGEGVVEIPFEVAGSARRPVVIVKHAGAADRDCGQEQRHEDEPVVARKGKQASEGEKGEQDSKQQEPGSHDFRMRLSLGGGVAKGAGDMRIAWGDQASPDDKGRKRDWGEQPGAEEGSGKPLAGQRVRLGERIDARRSHVFASELRKTDRLCSIARRSAEAWKAIGNGQKAMVERGCPSPKPLSFAYCLFRRYFSMGTPMRDPHSVQEPS